MVFLVKFVHNFVHVSSKRLTTKIRLNSVKALSTGKTHLQKNSEKILSPPLQLKSLLSLWSFTALTTVLPFSLLKPISNAKLKTDSNLPKKLEFPVNKVNQYLYKSSKHLQAAVWNTLCLKMIKPHHLQKTMTKRKKRQSWSQFRS